MRRPGRLRRVVVTGALVLPLAGLARFPLTPPGAEAGLLRLSWRMSLPAERTCRPRSAEEIEALPLHMRTAEVCEVERADYALVVAIDGRRPDTIGLSRGGVKGDRPLFVLEERALEPGRHGVRVQLERIGREGAERVRLAELDTVLSVAAGEVHLVTMGGAEPGLRVLRSGPSP